MFVLRCVAPCETSGLLVQESPTGCVCVRACVCVSLIVCDLDI